MNKEFEGRVALVTGGARGVCAGIAARLASEGAIVVICDVLKPEGEALAERLRDTGSSAAFHVLDVRSEEAWQGLGAALSEQYGRLDIVVNGAGILIRGAIENTSFAQYQKVSQVTSDGTFLSLKYCLPLLKIRTREVPQAAVVNVSSVAAFRGEPGALAYAASRAAMLSMTRSAALEFAQAGYGIRVNSVHPGSVPTELSFGTLVESGLTAEQANAWMLTKHPIGRLGRIEDIAEAVAFLASDRASWVTGTSLVVDGGRLA